MYLIFNTTGAFVMASSVVPSSHDSEQYQAVEVNEFDPKFTYSYIGGMVVKGEEVFNDPQESLRLDAEYALTQYQRDRATAYPSFADQFDLLFHGGYDAWRSSIETVKNKYPKPEDK